MYFIGLALFVIALIVEHMLKGLSGDYLINPAAIITLLLSFVAAVAATGSFKVFVTGLNAAVSKRYVISEEDRNKSAALFRLLTKVTLCVTVISAGISLYNIQSAISSVVIGVFFAVAVFEPPVFILKHRAVGAPEDAALYPKELADKLLEMCLQNGITPEDIKNASDIELK
ncbi:hypothetical protein FACS18949_09540 [Clostridia bacterium]|nr:hypothetical protein FACS18949_09540 [Clostridia bacterium]